MADDIIESQQVQETATEPTPEQQIAEQMAFRLDGKIPEQAAETQNTETGAVTETTTQTEAPAFTFQTFTDKFGYENPEAAIKEIEELRVLKANPTAAEIKYENEQSKQLAEALAAGEFDKVYEFLDEQKRLDKFLGAEVNEETADDIIKLGLKIAHKDLTDKEIDFKFNKTYGLPKEPKQGDTEDDDVFAERQQTWKDQCEDIKTSKIIDAKLAKPQLTAAKTNLVVPKIEAEVDEDYIQYRKDLEKSTSIDAETKEAYKAFTPKDIETRINFNDEANKIAFEFHYEPEAEGFKNSLDLVTDTQKYFEKYKNSDGSPNRKQFLQDIYFIQNKEKIIMAAMNQAKNATLKSQLPDNSQGSFQRQQPTGQEPNELHKAMQAAGVVV